jgi:excisionase family DNA binding protein
MIEKEIIYKLENIEQMLKDLSQKQDAVPRKEMLTVEEASKFLDLSKSYVYRLTSRKQLPYYCPSGKKILFRREDLVEFQQKNKRCTAREIENSAISYTIKNQKP